MASKPLSKSKIVAHMAEKTSVPKKTAAAFFEELFKLAVRELKGGSGKFVIPNLGRAVIAHRKARIGRRRARNAVLVLPFPADRSRGAQNRRAARARDEERGGEGRGGGEGGHA